MRAIDRLEKSGLTTAQIAHAAHTSTQAIRHYVHMRRFPNKYVFTALVQLAESRGILLLASDFITDGKPFASQRDVA